MHSTVALEDAASYARVTIEPDDSLQTDPTVRPSQRSGRHVTIVTEPMHGGPTDVLDGVSEMTGNRRQRSTIGEQRRRTPVPQRPLVCAWHRHCGSAH